MPFNLSFNWCTHCPMPAIPPLFWQSKSELNISGKSKQRFFWKRKLDNRTFRHRKCLQIVFKGWCNRCIRFVWFHSVGVFRLFPEAICLPTCPLFCFSLKVWPHTHNSSVAQGDLLFFTSVCACMSVLHVSNALLPRPTSFSTIPSCAWLAEFRWPMAIR